MNLLEMQILFQQIAEDTSPEFFDKQRSDTYNIVNYLNQSAFRYIQKKYLSFPTMELCKRFISENSNDLKDMIRKVKTNSFFYIGGSYVSASDGVSPYAMTGGADHVGPYGANSSVYHMPQDFMYFISCHVKTTRGGADVLPAATAQWQECKVVSHDQAERFLSNAFNKPIMREPVILFDADGYFTIIYDTDQNTTVNDIEFTYLRKPHTLAFDFQWMNGSSVVLTSAMINSPVRVKNGSLVEYPSNGLPVGGYRAGSKFSVIDGYYTLYSYNSFFDMYVGYPGDSTDELSIASYMHEDIVRLAVQMFLDEAKFKLVSKAQA